MYQVVRLLNGQYLSVVQIQDGIERKRYDTLEEAIKATKDGARIFNGTKIKKKDIKFLEEYSASIVKLRDMRF